MTPTKWGNNKDANSYQLLNLVLQHILGDHGSPTPGMVWYDSTNDVYKGEKSAGTAIFGETGSGGDADTLDGHDTSYFLARGNHTGTQLAATISDLATAVAALDAATVGTRSASYLLSRGNHTGTQLAATISDFASAVAAAIPSSYATDTEVADAVSAAIDGLVGGAGAAYDTLVELQALLEGDAASIATLTTAIGHRGRGLAFTIGDGSALTYNCDHNFGTKDVMCQAYVISSGAQFEPDFDRTTTNRVVVSYGVAPATNSQRILITEVPG